MDDKLHQQPITKQREELETPRQYKQQQPLSQRYYQQTAGIAGLKFKMAISVQNAAKLFSRAKGRFFQI
jgi:hypothetical protein